MRDSVETDDREDFYVRYYVGHKGKFGHEFLEFEFKPDGKLRYANNSNYKGDKCIRKEMCVSQAVLKELKRIVTGLRGVERRRRKLAGSGQSWTTRARNRPRKRTRVVSNREDWEPFRRAKLERSGRFETVLLLRAGFEVLRAEFTERAHESETYLRSLS
tara:strand:- start:31 stop:510 length:480 start_codon:yes stop_codon:yes gene_type:complete